ncbi:MAG: NAD+ synthase [Candidatus Aminicenantes bacterium]|nr:NAD+ synthase [Candidatus Aminicenantes bacterium]MDH5714654.1 NAD+ synthase [Candidatus Aminicenantes bacterium]
MKVTLAQLDPIVGDIEGNLRRIGDILSQFNKGSDLIVFPELFLVGYPPRDLLEKPRFIEKAQMAVQELINISTKYSQTGVLLGVPMPTGKNTGKELYNSALLIHQGKILIEQSKSLLPTYDVFDETRYFDPAPEIRVIPFKHQLLGISICEDAWNEPELWPRRFYPFDPIEVLAKKGATIFINISASPFYMGKEEIRYRLIQSHAKRHGIPFAYVNQVGGNDELIFDGRSICIDREGEPIEIFPSFKEHVKTVDMSALGKPGLYVPQDKIESIYEALILGIGDYMRKCGFSKAVIGLSGGIDSAVTCCLAKEAIGSENVLGVSMPSPYSSKESTEYARRLAENLGIQFKVITISPTYYSYIQSLREHLQVGEDVDITLQNIQARIRGNILMALSNKFGYLVLSTGNKSELAVGYCTLYGDMTGGLAVISDVPKTMIYELVRYINRKSEVIPKEIIERSPSAELKPNQLDQDTLPPYNILDRILYYYIEEGYSMKEILELNFDPEMVKWVIRSVNRNEYKRRQSPPGLKVTTKAFGVGRRMPIAARYDS